jgi:hypothetical protein
MYLSFSSLAHLSSIPLAYLSNNLSSVKGYAGRGTRWFSVTASVAHTAKTHFLSLTVTTIHIITQPQAYYSTKPLDFFRLKHYNHSDMHYIHGPVLIADFHIRSLEGSATKLS